MVPVNYQSYDKINVIDKTCLYYIRAPRKKIREKPGPVASKNGQALNLFRPAPIYQTRTVYLCLFLSG